MPQTEQAPHSQEMNSSAQEVVVVPHPQTPLPHPHDQTQNRTVVPLPELEEPHQEEEKEDDAVKPQEDTIPEPTPNAGDEKENVPPSGSYKEETTDPAHLPQPQKKALQALKLLVREALNNHQFLHSETNVTPLKEEEEQEELAFPPEPQTQSLQEPSPPEPVSHQLLKPSQDEETANPETENSPQSKEVSLEKVSSSLDVADDDGAKTVEAIEETIVSVSSATEHPAPAEQEPEDDKVAPPLEVIHPPPKEISIWGVPLLADERSDVILLKFLRARHFKVKDAFAMLKNTVHWRKEFKIDELLEEDLSSDLGNVAFMHGHDKEGHPVCYNVYGEFQSKELYHKTFSDEEKRQRFLRWRIQFLEKSIRKLDFTPGGISTIVQVNDLKNSPGPAKWELRQAAKQALQLLQDNYPEFVAKQVFVNVPWWYLAVNRMISPFLTQRTKSKFVFAGPPKSAETLFRYIAAEQVPVKYGGLSKDGEFCARDAVTEITVKPAAKHTVEFPVTQKCLLRWEVRVLGWDVSYGAEFVPSAEDSYTVIIQKSRKIKILSNEEEEVVSGNFRVGEPGKVILIIENSTPKKKKLLYRLKTKTFSD